jgi:hypothetical protein
MESPSLANNQTASGTDPAWDEAFLRVESYLRTYGLESHVLLHEVTASIIEEARGKVQSGAAGNPVELAMNATQSRIGAWLARSGQPADWTSDRIRAQGRLALIVADLPGRWPNSFLSSNPFPADLAAAMSSTQVLPAPEMKVSNMAPEPLEFGLMEPGDPRIQSKRIWMPIRAVVPWLLIFGFFGVAWASSH